LAIPTFVNRGKYKKFGHVIHKNDYHMVWVPKYRVRVLTQVPQELYRKLNKQIVVAICEPWLYNVAL
jgi:REP element-mobilizing transposase RayT